MLISQKIILAQVKISLLKTSKVTIEQRQLEIDLLEILKALNNIMMYIFIMFK